MKNKRFIVVCYAVHDKRIASCDPFETEDEALAFLKKDAKATYEEEYESAGEKDKETVELENDVAGEATLTSYNGEYCWTWQVVEIEL